jgi:hypothetical protein
MDNDQSDPMTSPEDHTHPEDDLDHCLCDIKVGDDEATDDSALPPAEGGVASDED